MENFSVGNALVEPGVYEMLSRLQNQKKRKTTKEKSDSLRL